jgi:hypothetical protein
MISDIHKKTSVAHWTGRVLGALVVLALFADAGVNLFAPQVLAKNMELTGFPDHLSSVIGSIILVCTVLYVIPRTAVWCHLHPFAPGRIRLCLADHQCAVGHRGLGFALPAQQCRSFPAAVG